MSKSLSPIEKLRGENYLYNKESTEGQSKSLPIDEEKFKKSGMGAKYPNDYNVLVRYLKHD